MLTVKLNNGLEVLGKVYKGEPTANAYTNRTQAKKVADSLGNGWTVYHGNFRPFYVGRTT